MGIRGGEEENICAAHLSLDSLGQVLFVHTIHTWTGQNVLSILVFLELTINLQISA